MYDSRCRFFFLGGTVTDATSPTFSTTQQIPCGTRLAQEYLDKCSSHVRPTRGRVCREREPTVRAIIVIVKEQRKIEPTRERERKKESEMSRERK